MRYFDAPDLKHLGKNGYRFINAVSDFATHAKPLRETANYRENVFAKTIEGTIEKNEKKYGHVLFRMGLTHLVDVGARNLTDESCSLSCRNIP